MIEKDFVTEGLKRTKIDEYLESELERAGYGGMDIQITPLGTMVVVYAERPGMVIGRGGKTVRAITQTLKTNFDLDNPQVEVKELDVPELNPKIMAYKIASMLQRGMHFRRVAYSTIRRIMGAGAQGVEVTISGKIRGSRSAVAKFVEGYIKKCGEPSTRFVKEGFATVQLKPGVLGIFVRIMPPDAVLPDKVDILPPKEETIENIVEEDEEIVKISQEPSDEELVEEEKELENLEELEEIEELEELEEIVEEIVEKETEDEAMEEIIEEIAEEEVEEEAIEETAEKILKDDEVEKDSKDGSSKESSEDKKE
ncbi:30S ribosomal protein S3 [Methanobrevibacter cuticularis]|uniref:Small ribosomal subunit protein uS3 n=1 Tax=Methanobrevibacter cuticularis TaxID=47311 RepID=A0A166FKQ3_9EURY|nr:30S ribosomal protein S3 [Methanobrevibacter cuticularis]KZX17774.1 30S ribosomal protein S3 [Methanobrevibacter cuticularis]